MLDAYWGSYTSVSLRGFFQVFPTLGNGEWVNNISGANDSQQYWKLTVPPGQEKLFFVLSGYRDWEVNDADMYARFGSPPSLVTVQGSGAGIKVGG
jgi:hypothetical protein